MNRRPIVAVSAAVVAFAACVGLVVARQPAPAAPAQTPAPGTDKDKAPAQPGQPGQPGQRGERERGRGREGGAGGPVNVEAAMKTMGRAMKQLASQIADASKKDENLKLINDMQRGCVAAKGAPVPEDVLSKAKNAAEKAKWSADYRKELLASLRVMIDIEQDILDGNGDKAAPKLDQLAKLRQSAHDELGVK